jgi:hypothetical protein
MTTTRDLIQQLAGLAKREHYTCEDSWYNCPRSEDGSANDNAGEECDCGADEHNAKVDAICALLSQPEPEGPTDEEILNLGNDVMGNCLPCDPDLLLAFARAVLSADRILAGAAASKLRQSTDEICRQLYPPSW